jgi:hypothetical protein
MFAKLATLVILTLQGFAMPAGATRPPEFRSSDLEFFKYASIGTDSAFSIPYRLWLVFPIVCSELLPQRGKQGFANFGWIYEAGRKMPIGMSVTEHSIVGKTVGPNCAACHTSIVRTSSEEASAKLVVGMPAQLLDITASNKFITDCILDKKLFTRERIVAAWETHFEAEDLQEFLKTHPRYQKILWSAQNGAWKASLHALIPVFRSQIKGVVEKLGDHFVGKPPYGFGRDDSTNLYKALFLNQTSFPERERSPNAEFMSVWNARLREGFWSHWDGSVRNRIDRDLLVAIGVTGSKLNLRLARGYLRERLSNIAKIEAWLANFDAPAYPFPIQSEVAEAGAVVYRESCMACHGSLEQRYAQEPSQRSYAPLLGSIIPLAEIGTDPRRALALNSHLAQGLSDLVDYVIEPVPREIADLRDDRAPAVESTKGYMASYLDGIYLRGPYLHNGAVPTLEDLLKAPHERPRVFYRGSNILDSKRLGFLSRKDELIAAGENLAHLQVFDTSLAGNSNQGHRWGTNLSNTDRQALIEYLKRF